MQTNQLINLSSQTLRREIGFGAIYPDDFPGLDKKVQKQAVRAKNTQLSLLHRNDYKPASYKQAVLFKKSMSYQKKISQEQYKQIKMLDNTNQFKVFGLGPYFFIQFQRRIVWLYLMFSILSAICIFINARGSGLQDYKGNFGSFLIGTTIGNFNSNIITSADTYILVIVPFVIYAIFFLFYIWWKCHFLSSIQEEDLSKEIIKPNKFCVQVQGFQESNTIRQNQLQALFSVFGPIYQISLARQYAGNLQYFEQLDELQEQIKQQQLQLVLGSGDRQKLQKLKTKKQKLLKFVHKLKIKPSIRSALIHFQFEKSKVDMLEYYSNHYLFNHKISHKFMRNICGCCVEEPEPRYLLEGKKLLVKQQKVPQPDDINWDSYEVSICGKIFRVLFAAFIIILFLAVSCAIIGLCSIYISSRSVNCDGFIIPATVQQASAMITKQEQKKCFCNSNFIESFSNQSIKQYCGNLLNQLYAEQAIQYAITATATIVNIIFGVIVHRIVNLTQPLSLSTAYLWKTAINCAFLIFNTVFLPLLIYADIFGFKATSYVSFITIISNDFRAFFKVQSIQFYVDFQKIWYKNVSPIFVNYIILDIVITWIFFILYQCCCSKEHLQKQEGIILQKKMNLKIISWKLNASDQYSMFILIIFISMFYCCGIPVIIPLAFLNLFSKYITNRSLIQSTSSRVDGLSQTFSAFPISVIPFIIISGCLVGSWMLSANVIIGNFNQMAIKIGIKFWVLQRQLLLPFFLILALVVLFQFLFYNTIVRMCQWLSQSCHDRKQVAHPYYTSQYSHYAKTMSTMHSYNIRNNIKYRNAVITLQRYLEGEQLKI